MAASGYSRIASLSSAKTLAQGTFGAIPTGITSVTIQAETQAVRYREDGINPTSTTGLLLAVGASVTIPGNGSNVRVLENAGGAALNVVFRCDGGYQQADTVAPTLSSATVDATVEILTLVFSEAVKGLTGVTITASGGAATLTYTAGEGTPTYTYDISRAIERTEVVTLDYAPGLIKDLANNALAVIADEPVVNDSDIDTIAPELVSATVDATGLLLTLVFDEEMTGSAGFTITPSGGAATVTYASGDTTDTLVYDINRAIGSTETLTISYAAGDVTDIATNVLEAITDGPVVNDSEADLVAPILTSATIDTTGLLLALVFDEEVTGSTGYTITPSGDAATLAYASGDTTDTLVFDISRTIDATETATMDYTPGNTTDIATNALEAIVGGAVVNDSTADTIVPVLTSATIDVTGLILTLVFDEEVTGSTGFTIDPSGGAATLEYASGDGTDTLAYAISRAIAGSETATLDYAAGDVTDIATNALATIVDAAVTNDSEVP